MGGCTFDYGETTPEEYKYSDITMEDLSYVRVRGGNPLAKLDAEIGERYEEKHLLELTNFTFEQYDNVNGGIDALGKGGIASVEMDSGNVYMKNGIHIEVASEDLIIETDNLRWNDKEKTLKGGDNDGVVIEKSDGTNFTGIGFSSDVRGRTWIFSSAASGTYVHTDDDEAAEAEVEAVAEIAAGN
ncbi:hypothetical protein FACS1894190_14440 [Spirochaetia bacterium]|nr:hypothetical protein FACS1894190_14440 [Spirochaetia bacterium]